MMTPPSIELGFSRCCAEAIGSHNSISDRCIAVQGCSRPAEESQGKTYMAAQFPPIRELVQSIDTEDVQRLGGDRDIDRWTQFGADSQSLMHRVLHECLQAVFVNLLCPVVGREDF